MVSSLRGDNTKLLTAQFYPGLSTDLRSVPYFFMTTSTRANKSNISPDVSPDSSESPGRLESSKPAPSESKPQSEPPKPEPKSPPEHSISLSASDTKVTQEITPAPVETVSTKSLLDREDIIDQEIFAQILELDEPNNHEFSIGMAWAYFDQAKETFEEMRAALDAGDLTKLFSLGHFLKGSSAALGVIKVRESCEEIQHYGNLRDEGADKDLTVKEALENIEVTIAKVLEEYDEAEQWLKKYYEVNAPGETLPDA